MTMIVTCQSCGSNERTDARYMAGRTSLRRCSLCRGLMIAEALNNFETRRFWAGIADAVCGPFTSREVKALIEHGEIHGGSWMWTWGMDDWGLVHAHPRLAFAAAWYRELHLPYLEPIVGEPVAAVTTQVTPAASPAPAEPTQTAGAEPEPAITPSLFGTRSALGEAGLHLAVAALTLGVLGSGVLAGGAIFS
jgi:hypothetical protein